MLRHARDFATRHAALLYCQGILEADTQVKESRLMKCLGEAQPLQFSDVFVRLVFRPSLRIGRRCFKTHI